MIAGMSVPALKFEHRHPISVVTERHDMLRMIMEWIADRFADTAEEIDTSIDWEDGEEHDEPVGPATL
jgi:hypothetical protein